MKSLSRRSAIKGSAAAAIAFALPRFSIGQSGPSANSKLNVAVIGVGGRGRFLIDAGLSANENLVAFCDVDEQNAASTYKDFPNIPRYKDFREMLDKLDKRIDAVAIATPDHTHFVATYTAMAMGKHVLTEKPLAHNVWQVRTLRKAAKHFGVVTQMGNQGHAQEGVRLQKEWYEAGIIGEAKEVVVYNNGPKFGPGMHFNRPSRYPVTPQAVPYTLDWDLWKGPTDGSARYNEVFLPKTWRGFYQYGNGQLGDWACHTLDGPFYALGLGAPSLAESINPERVMPGLVPWRSSIRMTFPRKGKAPLKVTWNETYEPKVDPSWGMKEWGRGTRSVIVGEKGCIAAQGYSNSPRIHSEELWKQVRTSLPPKSIPRIKGNHVAEWTNAIKGNGPMPGSNFDYASRLTEAALIGVIAQRTGERVEWDAKNMRITSDDTFNQYVKEPVRRGWEMGDELWR